MQRFEDPICGGSALEQLAIRVVRGEGVIYALYEQFDAGEVLGDAIDNCTNQPMTLDGGQFGWCDASLWERPPQAGRLSSPPDS